MNAGQRSRVSRSGHRHARRTKPPPPPQGALERAAALFRAVGDVGRLRLLHQLGDSEWCVSELAERAGVKLSTLSQQLRILHGQRIVDRRRDGKHVYYRLADEHVRAMVHAAIDHAAHG